MPPASAQEKPPVLDLLRRILRSKITIIAAAALLVYTLAGFLLAPYLVGRTVPRLAAEKLDRTASIGKVRINPFLLTFEANDVSLAERDGTPIAGFAQFFADFEVSSLFRWAWTFRELRLEKPEAHAVIAPDGTLNFARLVPQRPDAAVPAPEKDARPPRLVLQNIQISAGRITLTDQRQSAPAKITLTPLDVQLTDITTLPERRGPYALAATTGDGGSLAWTGELALHPLHSSGRLRFDGIRLERLWAFARDQLAIAPPAGTLSFETDYTIDLVGPAPQLTLENAALRLADLAFSLPEGEKPFFELQAAEASGARFDLDARQLAVEKLEISRGQAAAAVTADGTLDLQRIIRSGPVGSAPQAATSAADSRPWAFGVQTIAIRELALAYRDASRTPAAAAEIGVFGADLALDGRFGAEGPQLRLEPIAAELADIRVTADGSDPALRVDRLVLTGGAFDLSGRAFTASRIGLAGGNIDLVRDREGQINLALLLAPPDAGAVRRQAEEAAQTGSPWQFASQTVDLADFTVAINDQTVKPEGALVTLDPLKVTLTGVDGSSPTAFAVDLKVREGGAVTIQGSADPSKKTVSAEVQVVALALPPFQPYLDPVVRLNLDSGTFSTTGRLDYAPGAEKGELVYDGGFDVAKLVLTEPGIQETFLGWQHLETARLTLRLQPNRLEIAELKLRKPVGKLIIAQDRSVNVVKVLKTPPQAAPAASPAKSGPDTFPVRISKLQVQDGDLTFADLSLITPFATQIHRLTGVVIGTSSARDARAQIDLDGQVDAYGTARIGGEINVFDPRGFTDVEMRFENLEMANLTPYSGKFAGRRIDSGKLSLDLHYQIDNSRLLGDNQIVVDRLKLGDRVESPEALNLPLDLAVALLEDGNGVIDIGLPVKGDLNNPEFSVGHLVWKAFVNLITKIVTSPFRALGALLGGETENLDIVAFEPGKSEVPPPEAEKLQQLATAMQKRPQLKLVVQGRFSPQQDGEALQNLALRRALAALSGGQELAPEEDPGPVDYSDPATQRRLEKIFKERFGRAALKEFKAGLQPPAEKAPAPGQEAARDPGLVAKALFARLAAAEVLPENALAALAAARAETIVSRLTAQGGVAAGRVATASPEPAGDEAPVTSKLTLEIVQKPS
jgi:uncharacterized protein involved in outer membrane biogenesis